MSATNTPNDRSPQAQARATAEIVQRTAAGYLRDGAYATIGATDAAVSYLRQLGEKARTELPRMKVQALRDREELGSSVRELVSSAEQRFDEFTVRGRKVVDSIQRGDATKRTLERARLAKSQTKAATTTAKTAAEAAAAAAEDATATVGGETGVEYEKMTVDELRSRARDEGIEGRSEMTKSELIEALRNT